MPSYPRLERACHILKHVAPSEFSDVLREVQAIYAGLQDSLTSADPSAIIQVQGRAQQVRDFLRALDPPKPKEPSTTPDWGP